MQRGRKCIVALLLALGLVGAAGFAPEATQAKTHTARHADDHGRHGHGKDDKGHGKDDKGGHGHGKDDGAHHH